MPVPAPDKIGEDNQKHKCLDVRDPARLKVLEKSVAKNAQEQTQLLEKRHKGEYKNEDYYKN